jgi:hypothetical protein
MERLKFIGKALLSLLVAGVKVYVVNARHVFKVKKVSLSVG